MSATRVRYVGKSWTSRISRERVSSYPAKFRESQEIRTTQTSLSSGEHVAGYRWRSTRSRESHDECGNQFGGYCA